MSETIKLTINKRSSGGSKSKSSETFPFTVQLSATSKIADVKAEIFRKQSRLSQERHRITTEDKRALTNDEKSLKDEGVKSGDTLYVKDLGPQIAWKTVFLTEYAGPLFIHPLIYAYAPKIWSTFGKQKSEFVPSAMQTIALVLVLFHYVKREYETLFVHRFSNATMPAFNIFKNSTHYWILSGVLLAGAVYSPYYSKKAVQGTVQDNPLFLGVFSALFMLGQFGTGWAHRVLRNLRRPGTKERKIPRGGLFELVSCPNYTFEVIVWSAFTILTLNPAAALFTAVSGGQMLIWALKKHSNYRKEFKTYPRKRKAMIPFIM